MLGTWSCQTYHEDTDMWMVMVGERDILAVSDNELYRPLDLQACTVPFRIAALTDSIV